MDEELLVEVEVMTKYDNVENTSRFLCYILSSTLEACTRYTLPGPGNR